MSARFLISLLIVAGAAGCSNHTPTIDQPSVLASLTRTPHRGDAAALLTNIPISASNLTGWLTITHIAYDERARQLLFSGTVTRASDGLKDSFTNVPGTLSRASRAGPSSTSAISLAQTQFAGPCDILSFAIQPLDLDVLGLTLELSLIAIDVRGVPGPGNALGNLLCSVVTLLDNAGMTVSAINAQLDRVNTILATGS